MRQLESMRRYVNPKSYVTNLASNKKMIEFCHVPCKQNAEADAR